MARAARIANLYACVISKEQRKFPDNPILACARADGTGLTFLSGPANRTNLPEPSRANATVGRRPEPWAAKECSGGNLLEPALARVDPPLRQKSRELHAESGFTQQRLESTWLVCRLCSKVANAIDPRKGASRLEAALLRAKQEPAAMRVSRS